jgi:catechol 2,3-dioxygenase-like lactoylglutathione lyase family enzyme
MFSHVMVGTRDLNRASAFYDTVLAPLGIERVASKYENWAAWHRPGESAKFWVGRPFNGQPASCGNGSMTAFSAPSRAAVDAAYAAAIKAGASDEGPPGPRKHYAPDYYGAYVRDLDGNKLHFVRRGER